MGTSGSPTVGGISLDNDDALIRWITHDAMILFKVALIAKLRIV